MSMCCRNGNRISKNVINTIFATIEKAEQYNVFWNFQIIPEQAISKIPMRK